MKVAIIGAGITGLYLAWKLSEKGHKVTIFEKRNTIGKEACSGLFSERILQFIPQSKNLIQNEINFTLIHFPKKTVKVKFAKKFFVMNHAELDRLMANLAQESGVKIERDMAIHSVLPTRLFVPSYFSAKIGGGSGSPHPNPSVHSHTALYSEFEVVIGCDGANSVVRKSLGLPEPNYRLGILGFIACPERTKRVEWVETWPVKDGFIWKIPRGDKLEYGIIANLNDARKLLDDFCQKNNLSLEDVKSALIPQGFIIPKNDKITLCGDSAGFTKPWSGGGVIWSLQAADILLKNFPDFIEYYKEAKRVFYYKIILSKLVTKTVYFLGDKFSWLLPNKIKIDGDKLI